MFLLEGCSYLPRRDGRMRKSYVVALSPEERDLLEKLISTGRTSSKRQIQARILLKADASEAGPAWSDEQISEALDISVSTVARVRKRSVEQGLALGDGRYQEQVPELEGRDQNPLAEARDVVLVGSTDFLDQTMSSQPLEDSPNLRGCLKSSWLAS